MIEITLPSDVNTIVGGFAGEGSSSSPRRKYARQMLAANVISPSFLRGEQGQIGVNITFFDRVAI